jgi:nicotinate dehydrogenase subunit B
MKSDCTVSRRTFVKSAGGLVLGFSFADSLMQTLEAQAPQASAPPAAPPPVGTPLGQIDSWLRIAPNGNVSVFTGKVEIGQGVDVALMQIVAEELDVPMSRLTMVMGDTSATPDQGGVGGSNAIASGGMALRNVSATARALLLQVASRRLGAPVDQLQVRDGIVLVKTDPSKSVPYGELVGEADLKEALKVSGSGFTLSVQGSGKPKDPANYSVVGKSVRRTDISEKVFGTFKYAGDVRVPGMLHGRVIRPAGVGSKVVSVDDTAAKKIRGFVQAVVKGDFVGVVAQSEWGAVRAVDALKVTWSAPDAAFPEQRDLYNQMRTIKPQASRDVTKRGDPAEAMQKAVKRVEAVYEYPFHSHATMGPGCAVADVQMNGITTVWCGAQKPHAAQRGFAELIGVAPEKMRIVWVEDSGSYGRPFDDVGADALVLSQAVGKPVRVQWMRGDLTGWAPKGPAAVFEMRAGLDAQGNISGMQFTSRAFSGGEINFVPNAKGNFIAAQLMGLPNTTGFDEACDWGGPATGAPAYTIPDILAASHVLPSFHATPSPLAGTHLRDPNGPSTSFAVESFMDELAAAAGVDPIQFRSKYLDQTRAKAVLMAAAEKYGWQPRTSPNAAARGDTVTGRGVSLGIRGGTFVGNIAEVEVNRQTGAVRITRFVMAHDCGLVINPLGLTQTLQANVMQTLSRTMKEEVRFDRSHVTSVNWATYPIARMSDLPPQIEIVLLNRPEQPATGAGEAGTRAFAAAVANAIFDATGVRMRQVPFTPAKVKAALM